jgi:hypothetical protein
MQWSCSHFPLFKYMSIHMWTNYLPIIHKSRYEDELILMQATTTGFDHVQGFLHMVSLNLHSHRKCKIVSNRIANIDLRIEYIEYDNHRKYSIVADCHRFIDVSTNCQSAWLVSSETYVFNCLFICDSCCHWTLYIYHERMRSVMLSVEIIILILPSRACHPCIIILKEERQYLHTNMLSDRVSLSGHK